MQRIDKQIGQMIDLNKNYLFTIKYLTTTF